MRAYQAPVCLPCWSAGLPAYCADMCDPLTGWCYALGCEEGYLHCADNCSGGCETNIGSDVAHCGACNHPCEAVANAKPTCVLRRCTAECAPGFGDCDGLYANGCETDVTADPMHCGDCKNACPAGATCSAGQCK